MDLNKNDILFSCKNNSGDTTLRLNCFGYGGSKSGGCGGTQTKFLHNGWFVPSDPPDDGCRLVLGLGPTPSSDSDECCPNRFNTEGLGTVLNQDLSTGGHSILKLGLSGGTDEVSDVLDYSVSTCCNQNALDHTDQVSPDANTFVIPVVDDEGSTSAKKSGGYMPSLLLAPRMDSSKSLLQTRELLESGAKSNCFFPQLSPEPSGLTDYSLDTSIEPVSVAAPSDHRTSNNPKKCKFVGCTKGARGATGFCIGHGGGQRCQKPGCNKGAESRTAYCKAHGGGRRCDQLGCTKSAEGRTDYCIAHGGGRRCGHPGGCNKAARGKSGLCIRHGGGKRCRMEGCTRSAEGQIGLCISHGGGRRCQFQDCTKGAQGSTMFCKAHGGGKRCIFAGCTKGAEGSTPLCKGHGGGKRCLFDGGGICPKSVHGGTDFCVAHGGGKRCVVPGCSKSARGRTDCCVRHGGGKRCKFENCEKSAQGSTDFCKAHGGGKRCSWGEGKCEKFARGKSGLCAAHCSMAQERESSRKGGGMIGPGLFRGLVPPSSTVGNPYSKTYSSSEMSVMSDSLDSPNKPAKRQNLIPPLVLVPLSMKSSASYSRLLSSENQEEENGTISRGNGSSSGVGRSLDSVFPEGRVHGGGLMSLLGGNLRSAIDGV